MRIVFWSLGACAGACAAVLAFVACGTSSNNAHPADAGSDGSANGCVACVTDNDCNGGACAQIAGDSFCAVRCPNGNECSSDTACSPVTTTSGDQVSGCVPRGDQCGPQTPTPDAGAPIETCGSLVGPDVTAMCHCSSGKTCTANGCYGGWWCNTSTSRCQSPPAGCTSSEGGSPPGVVYDGGGPVNGTVGNDGGAVSRLYFAVVGDSRPASIDDTAGYPTAIITQIYSKLAALNPMPTFAVSTGDYMFASTSGGQASPQLDLYLGARAKYPGVEFPTMGNHECTGATASNCGPGSTNGATDNYNQFLTKLLAPLGQTTPYFEVDIAASDSSWTSKFLFVAANAWSQAQSDWLTAAMSRATTYTFIVRHEEASANTAPGVTPSEAIMAQHPYTLSIVGHTHTYSHYAGSREVIVGNGGAPLTSGKNYGFGVVSQRADQVLDIDMIDYSTGLADSAFHFAVKPDGTATQ
jgi:hypothetical protein